MTIDIYAADEQHDVSIDLERWIALANTHFQQGLMALVRAIAQPESF